MIQIPANKIVSKRPFPNELNDKLMRTLEKICKKSGLIPYRHKIISSNLIKKARQSQ